MILLIALTVGNLVAGIFLQEYGFLLSFFVALCLYVASLLYTVFILKESHPKSQRCKSSRTCLAEPIMIIDVIRKRRPGRSSLLLLTIIGEIHTKGLKLFESLFFQLQQLHTGVEQLEYRKCSLGPFYFVVILN